MVDAVQLTVVYAEGRVVDGTLHRIVTHYEQEAQEGQAADDHASNKLSQMFH